MNSISNKILTIIAIFVLITGIGFSPILWAGGTIEIDEFKKISIGVGMRSSYNFIEDANIVNPTPAKPLGSLEDGSDFALDSMRLYISGQIHEFIKFEFNTERTGSGGDPGSRADSADVEVMDGIIKLELNDQFNIWAGRFIPPSDRSNLSGPYYLNSWRFPFVQAYPNITNGRDEGVAYWGQADDGHFKWQLGAFQGNKDSVLNPDDNFLYAGRLTLNLWDPEPGYYNSSTYYGDKDILAIGLVAMSQSDSMGTTAAVGPGVPPAVNITTPDGKAGDFTGFSFDVLMEKVLADGHVMTLEGAYYDYDTDGTTLNAGVFPFSQSDGFFVLASYLFPETGWEINGRFQPIIRFLSLDSEEIKNKTTNVILNNQSDTEAFEIGLNYIIEGHNLRFSAVYGETSIDTKDAGTGAIPKDPDDAYYFTFGVQIQL